VTRPALLVVLVLAVGCADGSGATASGLANRGSPVAFPPGSSSPLPGTQDPAPGGDAAPAPGDPDPAQFGAAVDHLYFPLPPGAVWQYEGEDQGLPRREETRVLPDPETVLGVACTVFVEEVYLDGEHTETTTKWFAQDLDGNVWLFGDESVEYDAGLGTVTEDSWRAGTDGAQPWIFLPADPRPGDTWVGFHPGGEEHLRVLSVTQTADVPAGAFADCLEVEETDPDDEEDTDRIIYSPAVGLVVEDSADAHLELVTFGPG